jgi:hypothetical protein
MFMKVILTLVTLTFLVMGCVKNNVPISDAPKVTQTYAPSVIPSTVPASESKTPVQIQIFIEKDVYDGSKTKNIKVNNVSEEAVWMKPGMSDFGLFVPSALTVLQLKDGQEFMYKSDKERITLINEEDVRLPILNIEEDLSMYKEYVGSEIWDDGGPDSVRYDYFLNSSGGHIGYVILRYVQKYQDEVRPLFLDVIKYVQYVDQNKS